MWCCIYIAALLALVICEPNENVSFRNRGKNMYLQNELNVFKPQKNKQIPSRDGSQTIFGGDFVMDIEEAPFTAFLVQGYSSNGSFWNYCGATILNEKYLLSAAHCFQSPKPNSKRRPANTYTAFVGGLSIERSLDHANVKQYFIHPQLYFYKNKTTKEFRLDFDIAVIELNKELKFSSKISSVKLPPQLTTSGRTSKFPKRCTYFGFGRQSIHFSFNLNNLNYRLLKSAEVEIINPKNTKKFDCKEITKICTLGNEGAVCLGDSGGPLICDDIQEGIVSYSSGCLPPTKSVNTRVEYFVDWINTIIKGN